MAPLTIKLTETDERKDLIGSPLLAFELSQANIPAPDNITTNGNSIELRWGTEVDQEKTKIRFLMGALLDPTQPWYQENELGSKFGTLSADEVIEVRETGATHDPKDAPRDPKTVIVKHIGGTEL